MIQPWERVRLEPSERLLDRGSRWTTLDVWGILTGIVLLALMVGIAMAL